MFGVYLIHDNFIVRGFIWNYLWIINFINSKYFLLHAISIGILIFMVCIALDKIIAFLFDKPIQMATYAIRKSINTLLH